MKRFVPTLHIVEETDATATARDEKAQGEQQQQRKPCPIQEALAKAQQQM